jgi:hypothetical protein
MQNIGVELNDYTYMSHPRMQSRYTASSRRRKMPPSRGGSGPWFDIDVTLFKSWIEGGYQR